MVRPVSVSYAELYNSFIFHYREELIISRRLLVEYSHTLCQIVVMFVDVAQQPNS